ncbi:MAG: hypothetical protein NT154_14765 [Verrucomicrobia bacterium]|nr:hypothetical protein [Verrucomicrobiota bacterium]
MKALGLCLMFLAVALIPVSAQVTVEVTLEQDQYLPAESMPVAVRITNRSGQNLRLGAEDDWLTFSMDSRKAEVVPKLGEVPVTGEFVLESSRVATKKVDLAPYFSLNRVGRYSITATVHIKDWNQTLRSEQKSFDVIEGARLWEQDIGVPDSGAGTNGMPEVRKFILQQANYLKTQLRLYVRLTDESGARTIRVFPLGALVSFGRPEPQVDKFSNLHVLYQEGPHTFNYTVVNPDGEVITRQSYDYVDKRPRLAPDAEGKVLILGGVRRPTAKDVPPFKPESESEKARKPGPAPGEMMLPEL